ncbi:MAG: SiaB family protein kinase [Evtepia sp.]
MMFDMLAYYNMLKKSKVDIIYSGPIWADGVEGIGRTLRKRLELDDLPLTASQSVFSVFVEQMNNMLLYSTEKAEFTLEGGKPTEISTGVFILGAQGKKYFLQSGNLMPTNQADAFKARIDYLNTLDKVQLRKYYKEQIKSENKNPDSKGAGLGLIEIARRATSQIEYSFTPIDEEQSFFAMFVQIGE